MRAEFSCLPCLCAVITRILTVTIAIAMFCSGAFAQSQKGTLVGLVRRPAYHVITGVSPNRWRIHPLH